MMPAPSLQFYLRPRVTLTFDLLTPRVQCYASLPVDHFASWHQNLIIRVQNIVFNSLVTVGRTNERTGREHNAFACHSGLAEA